jgi:hypothetical protein
MSENEESALAVYESEDHHPMISVASHDLTVLDDVDPPSSATKKNRRKQSAITSSESEDHYTPLSIIDPARMVLEHIDLDPFSCPVANAMVKADYYFTKEQDGLSKPWGSIESPSRVWANPPGGKRGMAARCWNHAAREYAEGRVDIIVWMVFNMSTFQVSIKRTHAGLPTMVDGVILYFRDRVEFLHVVEADMLTGRQISLLTNEPALVAGDCPLHPSALILLPSRTKPQESIDRFIQHFEASPEPTTQVGLVRYDPRTAFKWCKQ